MKKNHKDRILPNYVHSRSEPDTLPPKTRKVKCTLNNFKKALEEVGRDMVSRTDFSLPSKYQIEIAQKNYNKLVKKRLSNQ